MDKTIEKGENTIKEHIKKLVMHQAHHLLNDSVEVAVRKDLLNLLIEPPVRVQVGDVSHFSCATISQHANNDATTH